MDDNQKIDQVNSLERYGPPTSMEPNKTLPPVIRIFGFLVATGVVILGIWYAYKLVSGGQDNPNTRTDLGEFVYPLANEESRLRSRVIATIPENFNTRITEYGEERFIFDDAGREVMYLAKDTKDNGTETMLIVRNDKLVGKYVKLFHLAKSGDGSRINYAGWKKIGEKDDIQIVDFVVNDIKQEFMNILYPYTIVFSDDGVHYTYVVNLGDWKMSLIYDSTEVYRGNIPRFLVNGSIPNSGWDGFSPVISKDGKRLAIVSQKGLKQQVVVIDPFTKYADENEPFDDVLSNPIFSSDSKHYAYRVMIGKSQGIVIDGTLRNKFENGRYAWEPKFSIDNNKVSYVTDDENEWKALDISTGSEIPYRSEDFSQKNNIPKETGDRNNNPDLSVSEPYFDQDGQNFANIVMDFSKADIVNSNDTDDFFYMEVNGDRINHSFSFVSEPQFDSSGKFVMFGSREGRDLKWRVYEITDTGVVER